VESYKVLYCGRLQPCPQILDLCGWEWKWQTLAYYNTTTIMAIKSVTIQAAGGNVTKYFLSLVLSWHVFYW